MDPPIRERGRPRLLAGQERLRRQIERNVARAAPPLPAGVTGPPPPAGARLPPPPPRIAPKAEKKMATAANLAEAREKLGDAVGLKPFKDYVRREYGEIDEGVLREFMRRDESAQVFGPPPRSDGKMATLGAKDGWYLDLISLPKGDPDYKYIMTAQNAYSGFLYALPLKSTTPSGDEGTGAVFEKMLKESRKMGRGRRKP